MALTKVSSDMVSPDPTNASNLSSGDVPLAQLDNVPAAAPTDTTGIEADIALLGFKVAIAGSMAKYNLVDQTEDSFVDQTGIDTINSTLEVYNAAGKYYSGLVGTPTGGDETTYTDGATDYVVRSFLSGTTNLVFDTSGTVDYLLVAGGGSGGGSALGGGGGAGGLLTATSLSVSNAIYPIVVGAGGSGGSQVYTDGEDTTAFSLTAIGGGYGGSGSTINPSNGGSGGGQMGYATTPVGTGTVGQGNNGGQGTSHSGGGGGGAGAVGANAVSPDGAVGGVGLSNSLRTNAGVFYAGGGGGSGWTGPGGAGGNGGGGTGRNPPAAAGSAGAVNTGGGGGGGNDTTAGGSGIAVVRWVAGSMGPASNNMTLQSNATTAETAPTKGDIVITYTNGIAGAPGEAVLNTDLTAEFSANDGGAWTPMTLVAQGTTGSASPHFIVSAHNVTLATASGTAMRYRIKTLNQTVSVKETRIQAASLGWS